MTKQELAYIASLCMTCRSIVTIYGTNQKKYHVKNARLG